MSANIYDPITKTLIPIAGNSDGGPAELNGLDDVYITTPSDGQILKYDGTRNLWVNIPGGVAELNDVGDVDISNPSDGQVIVWDNTNAKWVNGTLSYSIDDLDNVDVSSPTDKQILSYDAATSKWRNRSGGSTTVESLDDIGDVHIEDITDGDILKYDAISGKWINDTGTATIDELGDIADVDLTNLEDGQTIVWDDTEQKWIPGIGGQDYTAGHGISIDNGVISDKTFVGTTAEWEALDSAQQAFYEERVLTDDEPDVQQKTNGHTIKDEDGVSKTQRSNLQFEGLDVTDDDVNDKTIISPDTMKEEIYGVMGQMGAKNLLPNDATTQTISDVAFTVNDDGSVTVVVDTTPSANVSLSLGDYRIGPGQYIVSGCPSGGSRSGQTYWMDVKYDGSTYVNEIGEGIEFTVSNSISGAHVVIGPNCPIGTYTFYPMLRLASDTDDTYQPYAKTNKELSVAIDALDTNIISNGSKNLLRVDVPTVTKYGITLTNTHGMLTVSGTSTGNPANISIFGYDGDWAGSNNGVGYSPQELGIDMSKIYTFSRSEKVSELRHSLRLYNDNTQLLEISLANNEGLSQDIDFSQYPTCNLIKYAVVVGNGKTIAADTPFKSMLCLKEEYDADPTWAQYAKTNRQLTEDSVDWDDMSQLGAVNFLEVTATGTTTKTGGSGSVDFTVNADKSITINCDGTHTSDVYFNCAKVTVPKGSWKFSALQANSNMTYFMYLDSVTGITYDNRYDSGNGTRFTNSAEFSTTLTICVKAGTALNNVTIYPMIAPIDYNGDYVPYAKTNKELTQDSVNWDNFSEVGAVNHLKNNATTTTTTDGTTTFTWTVNDDKSFTVSAPSYPVTVASNQTLIPWDNISADECSYLVGKVFKLTGCPSGGSRDTYRVQIYRVMSADGSTGTAEEYGEGKTFTWSNNGSGTKAKVQMIISSGYTMTGPITFKPMLTDKHYNGSYVPYAKTNRELTEETKGIILVKRNTIEVTANNDTVGSLLVKLYDALSADKNAQPSDYYHYVSSMTLPNYATLRNMTTGVRAHSSGIQYNYFGGRLPRQTEMHIAYIEHKSPTSVIVMAKLSSTGTFTLGSVASETLSDGTIFTAIIEYYKQNQ